ncbi:SRPBCC domain-containing protein [Acidobacterium sp. S8]|uniref:SRPBCC domain-containing protein n=1 Tax=Acidobacterium sp. S8 TaxID=1641854 RepID=UPI00131DE93C|nr:SRPBCC domain-containing protein [Acidobacterium sp. S8]
MAEQTPLHFVFYIAATPDKVWEGFVSPESNRVLFMGAELEVDLKPGGSMNWVGIGADGKRTTYVHGEVLQSEPPKLLQYTFAIGPSSNFSRVTIELVPETEATKVSLVHDQWAEDNEAYASTADGWPRILSRLKTLIETGKTFKPH